LYFKDTNITSFVVDMSDKNESLGCSENINKSAPAVARTTDVNIILNSEDVLTKMESLAALIVQSEKLQIAGLKAKSLEALTQLSQQESRYSFAAREFYEIEDALTAVIVNSSKDEKKSKEFRNFITPFIVVCKDMSNKHNQALLKLMSAEDDIYDALKMCSK